VSIKASVFIAASLDGFIARANGDLDWLTGVESASTSQDYGYQEFMDSVDTIVLGRNTFELVLTFDTWPYIGKKVFVLSSGPNAANDYFTKRATDGTRTRVLLLSHNPPAREPS
jgi:dihydrofolate reductase